MEPLRRTSLSEQVLDSIISYIKTNELKYGDRLPTEAEFSDLFQVSRTSVREAMKALSINRAVESIPGRGTFLRPEMADYIISHENCMAQVVFAKATIHEILEVRTALETLSIDLAIERGTDAEFETVVEAMQQLKCDIYSGKPWCVSGTRFHISIATISGNNLLIQQIESLSHIIGKYKDALYEAETNMERHIVDHQNILDALLTRNRAAAHLAIDAHMRNTEADLRRLVDERTAESFIEIK